MTDHVRFLIILYIIKYFFILTRLCKHADKEKKNSLSFSKRYYVRNLLLNGINDLS